MNRATTILIILLCIAFVIGVIGLDQEIEKHNKRIKHLEALTERVNETLSLVDTNKINIAIEKLNDIINND